MSLASALADTVLERGRAQGLMVATAESCTGGLVAAALTGIAGSSDVFDRGFVTYSDLAKRQLLGVPEPLLIHYGAVSEEVARAMAEGALDASAAAVSVAVTGIAGPSGGTAEKPVGLVWFAAARRGRSTVSRQERYGDLGREAVRSAATEAALRLLLEALA